MRSSNLLVAFAAMGSLTTASLAEEQVATIAPGITPQAQAHFEVCSKLREDVRVAGDALKSLKVVGTPQACSARLKFAEHGDRMIAFLRECAPELGMTDAEAGRKMVAMKVSTIGLRESCKP